MQKFAISPFPYMNAMTDAMGQFKNMVGGLCPPNLSIAPLVMPTLSVEDINKQVNDLKAVEAWMTVNMNMLRGTIQALEVQSATISAAQSMGMPFSNPRLLSW